MRDDDDLADPIDRLCVVVFRGKVTSIVNGDVGNTTETVEDRVELRGFKKVELGSGRSDLVLT